jgi:amidohydrolase
MDASELGNIILESEDLHPWLTKVRRWIHQHPELSYHETETAAYIASVLNELGIEVIEGIAGNGVVGLIRGEECGTTVAIRADMDALPINEEVDVEYRSIHENRMHACGHDGHMAIALGVGKLLAAQKKKLKGNLKLIFQPAEEVPPIGGAKGMIEEGVLKNPDVSAIFGLHMWPEIPSGEIGLKAGPIMAEADRFEIIIHGKGGHGAAPHRTNDTFVMTAQTILALQTVISRMVDPLKPAVLSFGKCQAGTAYNIIPDKIQLEGTTRYFERYLGSHLENKIRNVSQGVCQAYGGSCELDYQYGFPPTINDAQMTSLLAENANGILGVDKVHWVQEPSMTGEDFSYFLQKLPGCYFWLGTQNPDQGIIHPLHSSHFQLDEEVLNLGVAVLTSTVINYLNLH